MYNNIDWEALYSNLRKSHRRWGMVAKVMGKMGAPIKAKAMVYKALVQAVFLYASEIWLVKDAMMKVLKGFYHSITILIAGMIVRKGDGR